MLARQYCCLWSRQVSSGLRQRQQILACETVLLPLDLAGFIWSLAEAAKSCFRGAIAAFGSGEFHRVFGGGSKILLRGAIAAFGPGEFLRVDGGGSKILLLKARLLPLALVSFFGSLAEAAKSYFRGAIAAFDPDAFHRVFGRGSKILLLRRGCCLWAW